MVLFLTGRGGPDLAQDIDYLHIGSSQFLSELTVRRHWLLVSLVPRKASNLFLYFTQILVGRISHHLGLPTFEPVNILHSILLPRQNPPALPSPITMNNNSPRGQTSQNPSSMNNARAVHRPAGHGVMYHNNGMQVQTANYVQVGNATQD